MDNNNNVYMQHDGIVFSAGNSVFANSDGDSAYKNQTGTPADNSGFCFWCCLGSCVVKGGASVIATLGSAYLTSNANVDIAKATHQNPLNKSTGVVGPAPAAPVNHTMLYTGLGIVGALALAGGIFMFVRKKGKSQ